MTPGENLEIYYQAMLSRNSTLREAQKTNTENGGQNRMVLRLPFRPPLDWPALLSYLKARQIQGVEAIDNDTYSRSICIAGPSPNNPKREHQDFFTVKWPGKAPFLELNLQMNSTADLVLKRTLVEMSQQEGITHREVNRPGAWRPWRAYAAMYLWKKWNLQPK